MTEQVEQEVNEPTANPYNSKKSWHTPDAPNRGDADSLFYDDSPQQATSEEAPVEEEAPAEEAATEEAPAEEEVLTEESEEESSDDEKK